MSIPASDSPSGPPGEASGAHPRIDGSGVHPALLESSRDARPFESETPSDPALLHRIGIGDRQAFQLFYERWSPRVTVVLRRLSRGSISGHGGTHFDDVVQEVFLAVWGKAASYDASRGDVGGWIYIICRNKWIDCLRRQPPPPEERQELGTSGPAPRDAQLDLLSALSCLREAEREAVQLAFFDGFTHEESAVRLGIPLGTLKSRIRLGLQKMARSLRGYRS